VEGFSLNKSLFDSRQGGGGLDNIRTRGLEMGRKDTKYKKKQAEKSGQKLKKPPPRTRTDEEKRGLFQGLGTQVISSWWERKRENRRERKRGNIDLGAT